LIFQYRVSLPNITNIQEAPCQSPAIKNAITGCYHSFMEC